MALACDYILPPRQSPRRMLNKTADHAHRTASPRNRRKSLAGQGRGVGTAGSLEHPHRRLSRFCRRIARARHDRRTPVRAVQRAWRVSLAVSGEDFAARWILALEDSLGHASLVCCEMQGEWYPPSPAVVRKRGTIPRSTFSPLQVPAAWASNGSRASPGRTRSPSGNPNAACGSCRRQVAGRWC